MNHKILIEIKDGPLVLVELCAIPGCGGIQITRHNLKVIYRNPDGTEPIAEPAESEVAAICGPYCVTHSDGRIEWPGFGDVFRVHAVRK